MDEFVYFFGNDDGLGPTKIGRTRSLKRRLKTMRTHSHIPLDCYDYILVENGISHEIEREFHKHFKDRNVSGEWFDVTKEEVLAAVDVVFDNLGLERIPANKPEIVLPPQRGKVGRPSTGFDRNAYQRAYMADQRKASKLGMTVSEYRKGKADDVD